MSDPGYSRFVPWIRMAGGIGGLPSSGFWGRLAPAAGTGESRSMVLPVATPRRPLAIVLQQRTGSRAIRELPVSERPRERLALRGAAGLTSAELIALLWGSGSRGMSAVELAEEALGRYEGLTGLARATGMELEAISGVGEVKAAQLAAAFELGRRLMADWPSGRWTIRAPKDVADRLVLQMGRLEHEELRVVLLNTKNVVLRVVTVYQGNVSSSLVRVGELYRDAVRLNAAGAILVHNHPSGDPTPSRSGRTAWMLAGVRPTIRFASAPIARTRLVLVSIATTDGSLITMPRSFTWTSVLAVPRSIPMSRENRPSRRSNMVEGGSFAVVAGARPSWAARLQAAETSRIGRSRESPCSIPGCRIAAERQEHPAARVGTRQVRRSKATPRSRRDTNAS